MAHDFPLKRIPYLAAKILHDEHINSIKERNARESKTEREEILIENKTDHEKNYQQNKVQPLNFLGFMVPVQNVHERKEHNPRSLFKVKRLFTHSVNVGTGSDCFAVMLASSGET